MYPLEVVIKLGGDLLSSFAINFRIIPKLVIMFLFKILEVHRLTIPNSFYLLSIKERERCHRFVILWEMKMIFWTSLRQLYKEIAISLGQFSFNLFIGWKAFMRTAASVTYHKNDFCESEVFWIFGQWTL